MKKQTFDVGDRVIYSHPLTGLFRELKATIPGKVIKVDGSNTVKIEFTLGTIGNPKIVYMWCELKRLESKEQIPDPEYTTKKLDAAEKIAAKDWDGWIFDESIDKYFESFDELLEHYEGNWAGDPLVGSPDQLTSEDEEDIPNWAWATKMKALKINDAIDLIEDKIENLDAGEVYEATDFEGDFELQLAIDTFNNLNQTKIVYSPDYTKAILYSENSK
jgi:hypothetical protein